MKVPLLKIHIVSDKTVARIRDEQGATGDRLVKNLLRWNARLIWQNNRLKAEAGRKGRVHK